MSRLRIWHFMIAVLAAAILFAVARFDEEYNSCSPISPLLATSYLFGLLGIFGARSRGRRGLTGLWLGLLLGPFGLILACSNPAAAPELFRDEKFDAKKILDPLDCNTHLDDAMVR